MPGLREAVGPGDASGRHDRPPSARRACASSSSATSSPGPPRGCCSPTWAPTSSRWSGRARATSPAACRGNGANFHFLNRNKRSITIDLKGSPQGRELFLRLARGSDVVIDNFAHGGRGPGARLRRAGAREPAASSTWRSRASCPARTRRARSSTSWPRCRRGLAFMTGPRGQPLRAGASIVDVGAAAYGVIAVLAALHAARRTPAAARRSPRACSRRRCSGSASGWPTTAPPASRRCRCRRSARARGWAGASTSSSPRPTASRSSSASRPTPTGSASAREFGLADLLADERLDDNASAWPPAPGCPARIAEEMAKYPSAALAERLERAKCRTRRCGAPISWWTIRT